MKRILLSSVCLLGAPGISADAVNNGRQEAVMRILKEWKECSSNVIAEKKTQQIPALFEKHKNTIFAELKQVLLFTRDHSTYLKDSKNALMACAQVVKSYPAWSRSITVDDCLKDATVAQLVTSVMAMAASNDEMHNVFFKKYDAPFLKEFYADYPSSVEQVRAMGAVLCNPVNQVLFMQGPLLPVEQYCWDMAVKGVDIAGAVGDEVIAILKDNLDVICAQLDVLHAMPDKSLDNAEFVRQLLILGFISAEVSMKFCKPVVAKIVSEKSFGGTQKVGEFFEKGDGVISKAFDLVRNDEWFANTWQKTHKCQEILVAAIDKCRPAAATTGVRNACGCCASGVDVRSCPGDNASQCACCRYADESCGETCVDKSPCLDENKI